MNQQIKKLKIGVYSPYLHIFGGGERYLLSIAESLSQYHEVFLFSDQEIADGAKSIFDISLSNVHFLSDTFLTKNALEKYILLKKFDAFFYMTDGSVFFPGSKKNYLLIQSPIHIPRFTYMNRIKLINWKILCYSKFMQKIIESRLHKNASILSPCVDIEKFKSNFTNKKNIILSVGRFFRYPHHKKHDLLIEIFKKNYQKYFKDWKLIIAGGLTEKEGNNVISNLKQQTVGFPVKVVVNPTFTDLIRLYKMAKLYWHAAGFGDDIQAYPEKTEHFGITTLEAMAAGAVPLVFAAGGQKDIIEEGKCGYLWENEKEFLAKNQQLINNEKLLEKLSSGALSRVDNFSCIRFYEKINRIITA